jgi:hypothetical protein
LTFRVKRESEHDGVNKSGQGINRDTGCFPASGDVNGSGRIERARVEWVAYDVPETSVGIETVEPRILKYETAHKTELCSSQRPAFLGSINASKRSTARQIMYKIH